MFVAVGTSPQLDIRRRARPYSGWAGYSVDQFLPSQRSSIYELVLAAARSNVRVNAIAATPKLLAEYLQAFEAVNDQIPIKGRRFVLIHVGFASEEQQEQMKRLGVVPTVHVNAMLWKAGSKRIAGLTADQLSAYVPLNSYADQGIPFVLATDNIPIDPLQTFWVAVSRQDRETGQVIAPDQRISRAEALRALTINGAYLSFDESNRGSIEVGKRADLVVLSDDLLTIPDTEIRDIDVLRTMVGGRYVYQKAGDRR